MIYSSYDFAATSVCAHDGCDIISSHCGQDFLKQLKGLSSIPSRVSAEQTHVQTLLARLESSSLLEDRKRAIEELQDHVQKFPAVVSRRLCALSRFMAARLLFLLPRFLGLPAMRLL